MEDKDSVKRVSILRQIGIPVIIGLIVGIIIISLFRVSKVDGISMEPTLEDGDSVVLDLTYQKRNGIRHNDIVVFKKKLVSDDYYVKRVIGIAGDKVEVINNELGISRLYINDKEVEEDYIKEEMITDEFNIIIPEGNLFVMGDNRNKSLDSREAFIGLVNIKADMYGKVIFNITEFEEIE